MDEDTALLLCGTPALPPGCVALTFDDGPGPHSAELSLMLRDEGVPATFFVLGESLERYGQALDVYRECGHVIALHGEFHRPFTSVRLAAHQLRRCRQRLDGYLDGTVWFRPPFGIGDQPVEGYAGPVGWHAHGRDWEITYRQGQTVAGCVDGIAGTLARSQGGIALLHDYAPYTEFTAGGLTEADLDLRIIEITSRLIGRLREHGFSFVGLPDPAPERLGLPLVPAIAHSPERDIEG
jgi:peptidoglycan/xylan/chitin deacetylase (PgdA/CDA1 family)